MATPTPNPSERLLTPENCTFTLIDHQPRMALGVNSIDDETLRSNVAGLAKAAKALFRRVSSSILFTPSAICGW